DRLLREQIEDFGALINTQLAANATEPLFTDQFFQLDALIERIVSHPRILGAAVYNHLGQRVAGAGQYPRSAFTPVAGQFQHLTADQLRGGRGTERVLVHSAAIAFKDATGGFATLVFS